MTVALVGFGIEGVAALAYWRSLGADITICDQNSEIIIPDGIASQLGEGYLNNLDRFDTIWRTASLNPETILHANPTVKDKITSTINEFLRVSPTKHIIGVTGTKGKGTTSTLMAKMLEAAGEKVFLGGNIGVSPLEFLPRITEETWIVLELSSFQLSDLKYSPSTAVCLMVVPEHLNWHKDMDDYIVAKAHLFEHQSASDLAIYLAGNENSLTIAGYSPGLKMPYMAEPGAHVEADAVVIAGTTIIPTGELKLLGKHNWQNVCAAVTAVWQVTQNIEAIRSVLASFTGLEHRLEFVREASGIKYYNDSFAATPDAAIAALDALPQPKVAIIGGFDRNLPLGHLAQSLVAHQSDIRKAILIGAGATRLSQELGQAGFSTYVVEPAKDMATIVAHASQEAQSGDVVLLSPGFSSFDMFKNFVDRGEQFKAAVQKL